MPMACGLNVVMANDWSEREIEIEGALLPVAFEDMLAKERFMGLLREDIERMRKRIIEILEGIYAMPSGSPDETGSHG